MRKYLSDKQLTSNSFLRVGLGSFSGLMRFVNGYCCGTKDFLSLENANLFHSIFFVFFAALSIRDALTDAFSYPPQPLPGF